jgi:hypothetical protein
MAVFRCGLALLACSSVMLVGARSAEAATPGMCRVINVDFTPGGIPAGSRAVPGSAEAPVSSLAIAPQIVAWLERPTGEYVDTLFITSQTGRYGIGNRPGRFDFNSGPSWPYGRRITVFPVWSHKHGLEFPAIAFRNGDDDGLSHPFAESSLESHFCRPLQTSDSLWDAVTCSSTVYTDKGVFVDGSSKYPPRADLTPVPGTDSPSVAMFKAMNPFDAVSQATPRIGEATQISWPIPDNIEAGDYVLFMEVALEQDFNQTYNPTTYPGPSRSEISYSEYGIPYRGQPSVIYRVPFTVTLDSQTIATTDTWVGYGDPKGSDGAIRPPDATITTDLPNSGALRLLLTSSGVNDPMFRVRVDARSERDYDPPSNPGSMVVTDPRSNAATVSFQAPGDDGVLGKVRGYEVRYVVGAGPINEDNFGAANEVSFDADVVPSGASQALVIKNLLPETEYTVAVRAFDDCHNTSAVTSTTFSTTERAFGEVDACFVATAAYGSMLANDVEMLRRFRDNLLKRSVLGELAVQSYYTFGPAVAGVVGESDLLRSTARDLLGPLVDRVRGLRW